MQDTDTDRRQSATASSPTDLSAGDPLRLGSHTLKSRLIVGTGKYETFQIMRDALAVSGTHCLTVAVRREQLYDEQGQNIR